MNNLGSIIRTNSDDHSFQNLVVFLDNYLKIIDGEDHSFYVQFNKIDKIKYAIVYYLDNNAVGCGAFKIYSSDVVEIKRMFVLENYRGKGIAGLILNELELWSKELNYTKCILETGIKQSEAIRLYRKAGYTIIPNYGQYKDVLTSVCMSKSN